MGVIFLSRAKPIDSADRRGALDQVLPHLLRAILCVGVLRDQGHDAV